LIILLIFNDNDYHFQCQLFSIYFLKLAVFANFVAIYQVVRCGWLQREDARFLAGWAVSILGVTPA
jgi:hypothetical protein